MTRWRTSTWPAFRQARNVTWMRFETVYMRKLFRALEWWTCFEPIHITDLLRRNKREKQLGDMLPVQSRMVTVYKPNRDSDKNLSGKESTSLYSSWSLLTWKEHRKKEHVSGLINACLTSCWWTWCAISKRIAPTWLFVHMRSLNPSRPPQKTWGRVGDVPISQKKMLWLEKPLWESLCSHRISSQPSPGRSRSVHVLPASSVFIKMLHISIYPPFYLSISQVSHFRVWLPSSDVARTCAFRPSKPPSIGVIKGENRKRPHKTEVVVEKHLKIL